MGGLSGKSFPWRLDRPCRGEVFSAPLNHHRPFGEGILVFTEIGGRG